MSLPHISARLRDGEALPALVAAHQLYCNPQPIDGVGTLVQLTYHQSRSPHHDPLVQQCRGLILRASDWAPVCWGMDRFFNHHEVELADLVPPLRVEEKEDGTYLLLFHDGARWAAATRHTFCHNDRRYLALLLEAVGHDSLDAFAEALGLAPGLTCCLELCGPGNRIIRPYRAPAVFLLAAYPLDPHQPLSPEALDAIAARSGGVLRRPRVYPPCGDVAAVQALLQRAVSEQRLFEGFVVTDQRGVRVKVKSPLHQRFERYKYLSWAAATPKDLLPYILRGDAGWLLGALDGLIPDQDRDEYARRLDAYTARLRAEAEALAGLWAQVSARPKRDAVSTIQAHPAPTASLLLRAWRSLPRPASVADLYALLCDHPAEVLRRLFPGKDAQSPLTGMLGEHGDRYCPPPADPPPGVASRRPERGAKGWSVWCACGAPMRLERLKIDRVRYRRCHCGEPFGLHVYRAGMLLWVCGGCDATHEAHQQEEEWDGEGIRYEKGQPLGIPATHACKALRLQVHREMARMRARHGLSKDEGYAWLAQHTGLTRAEAHVALFDAPRCAQLIRTLQGDGASGGQEIFSGGGGLQLASSGQSEGPL